MKQYVQRDVKYPQMETETVLVLCFCLTRQSTFTACLCGIFITREQQFLPLCFTTSILITPEVLFVKTKASWLKKTPPLWYRNSAFKYLETRNVCWKLAAGNLMHSHISMFSLVCVPLLFEFTLVHSSVRWDNSTCNRFQQFGECIF